MKQISALAIEGLSFSYGKIKALNNVSFTVDPGQCVILLGPNGAGKSTLFSLITRLYDRREGSISINGFDIKKKSCQALGHLGVVFQQSTLDMDLTVLQNLRYHAALHGIGRKLANQRIQQELERFKMFDRRKEKIRQLNGGHRRRVEIARALLHNPALLLLDEPTVGLDLPSRQSIVEYVHQLCSEKNIAVLWATHLIDEIYDQDHVLILHQGSIRASGSSASIQASTQSDSISNAFHHLTQKSG